MLQKRSNQPPQRSPKGAAAGSPERSVNDRTPTADAISTRAYAKFAARGHVHGFDQEDWTAAQRELAAEQGEGAGDSK